MMKWFQRVLPRKPHDGEVPECDDAKGVAEEKERMARREHEVSRRIDSLEHLADALRQAHR